MSAELAKHFYLRFLIEAKRAVGVEAQSIPAPLPASDGAKYPAYMEGSGGLLLGCRLPRSSITRGTCGTGASINSQPSRANQQGVYHRTWGVHPMVGIPRFDSVPNVHRWPTHLPTTMSSNGTTAANKRRGSIMNGSYNCRQDTLLEVSSDARRHGHAGGINRRSPEPGYSRGASSTLIH